MPGASAPKLKDQRCYGWNLGGTEAEVRAKAGSQLQLSYLLEAYRLFPDKSTFFLGPVAGKPTDYFFNKLAGNDILMAQIKSGLSEEAIRASWKPGLDKFKSIRKKYLMYE